MERKSHLQRSFEFPYMSNSVFNATQMDDYVQLLGRLEQKNENELSQNTEFMEEALENTKKVLEQFLTTSELTKGYKVVFR